MTLATTIADELFGVRTSQSEVELILAQLDGRFGWKLVPVEPTEEMLGYGREAHSSILAGADTVYSAMLAAAPDPLTHSVKSVKRAK